MMKTTSAFSVFVYEQAISANSMSLLELFKTSSDISALQEKMGYHFSNIDLLIRALSHTSFIHEYTKEKRKSYERLEFLGDSILGSYVTYHLFNNFEDFSEGKLSKLRSALVNERSLAKLARFLNVEQLILLGKGELSNTVNESILCDVFESLIGAVTFDSSMDEAFKVLDKVIDGFEKEENDKFFSEDKLIFFDPKTTLQEKTMKAHKCLPEYRYQKQDSGFEVELWVKNQFISKTVSNSKKEGEKFLALQYLENDGDTLC